MKSIIAFLNNGYVTNIICGLVTVLIIYYFQIVRNKRKIKQDFRCAEIFDEMYFALDKVDELKTKRYLLDKELDEEIRARKEKNKDFTIENEIEIRTKHYQEFYNSNKACIVMASRFLTYNNNIILLDSVGTVFFINTNFKLLGILNNIKNRIPNVEKAYNKIDDYANKDYTEIHTMITDIIFLSDYYKELYEYIGYDLLYSKARMIASKKYEDLNLLTLINGPVEERKKFEKDYIKTINQEYKRLKKEHKKHK